MPCVELEKQNKIAIVRLNRGKVHALNEVLVDELTDCFDQLEQDQTTEAVILTGSDKFFSFGLDIPELFPYSQADFKIFLQKFTTLYKNMYLLGKPLVAAINGHCIAGGCILASTADNRIMVGGKAKIALNEASFGSTIFAGAMAILRTQVGQQNAEKIALSGAMFTPQEALEMSLVDDLCEETDLMEKALKNASRMISGYPEAYGSVKQLLRRPIVSNWEKFEPESIEQFIEIWYSPSVRENLKKIEIK